MRSAALGFLVVLVVAAAAPDAAAPGAKSAALTLSVDRQVYVIPTGRLYMTVPVGFHLSGSAGRRVEVWHCRNGQFDGSKLSYSWPPCSSGDSVFAPNPVPDNFTDDFGEAGRYESFARTSDEISNFVTYTVLDECRWTVVRDRQSVGHSEPGMPYHCNHLRNGPLELRGDDGSRLISTGVGGEARNRYYPNKLSHPDLGISVGEATGYGIRAGSLRLRLGPALGGYLVHVQTPAGFAATFSRADFSVSHRRRVTKIHVYSGRVVIRAGIVDDVGDWVEVACDRRVSLHCLRRMPRTLTLKPGQTRRFHMH